MISISVSTTSNLSPEEEKALELLREFASHLQSSTDKVDVEFVSDLNAQKEASVFHRKGEYISNIVLEADTKHVKIFARKHFHAPKFLISAIDIDEENGDLVVLAPFKPKDLKGLLRKNIPGYTAKNSS